MKLIITSLCLLISVYSLAQNVGINITNPAERLHIQDNATTKLLLRTTSGTSFFTADSPSNSGLLFRFSGLDRAFMFYSPFSNSLSAGIGLNGWTMSANGDFRVKERIYALDDLRLDAEESITIEANGALIKIDPSGNVEIQGNTISINAQQNLTINANNISIAAANQLDLTSGGKSTITANDIEVASANEVDLFSLGDFNVQSDNLDFSIANATNIVSGTSFALTSQFLTANTAVNTSFAVGNNLSITSGSDFSFIVGDNYTLDVLKNYNLDIGLSYDLDALTIKSQASSSMNLLGSIIKFNNGTTGFARLGDSVEVGGKPGIITSASQTVFGN